MRHRIVASLVTSVVLATAEPGAAADVRRQLDAYVLFASQQLRTRGLLVTSGDLGVDAGVFSTRGDVDAPTSTLGADVVHVGAGTRCGALFATGVDAPLPACPLEGVFPGSIFGDLGAACGAPTPVPACDSAQPVTIGRSETRTLAPGAYGRVALSGEGSTLELGAGSYAFCELRISRHGRLHVGGPTNVFVAGNVTVGPGTTVAGDGLDLVAAGTRVSFARGATVTARACAPAGLLIAGDGVSLHGRFAARAIRTGHVRAEGLTGQPSTTTSTSSSSTSTSVSSTSTSATTTSSSTSSTAPPTTSTTSTSTSVTSSTAATLPTTTQPPTTSSTSTTSTSTTTSSTATTRPAAVCGNGSVEPGETCDDGNTRDGDGCPSNCRIESCTPVAATARVFDVTFTPPAGQDVAGVTVLVDYPEGRVGIPGSGGATTVRSAITNLPAGAFGTPNDLDYAVREVVASFGPIPAGRLFTVTFEDCQGATPAAAADFRCVVEDAADTFGLPVTGVTCSVQPG